MEDKNLLRQFYEEELKSTWNVEFESFNETDLILIKKTTGFSKWKADQRIKEFENSLNELVKSVRIPRNWFKETFCK